MLTFLEVILSLARRAIASFLSSGVSFFDVAGKSSRKNGAMSAIPIVKTPSTMKSQRHPGSPCAPSRLPAIIPAMIPPKAPERMEALKKKTNRVDLDGCLSLGSCCSGEAATYCSSLLYHELIRKKTPGY